jgi:hypothetical protein
MNDCRLCRCSKIPRRLEGTPDIRVFRAAIKDNQFHAVRALHLVAITELLYPFGKGLFAFGTQNFNAVGHENFQAILNGRRDANPLSLAGTVSIAKM